MTISVNRNRMWPLLALLLIILFSCTAERKFAREFIRNDSTRNVLVMPPELIYKTSLKAYEIKDAGNLDPYVLDSLLYENSLFLKYIWDTVFIEDYYNTYCEELENLGYTVYSEDSLISFLSGKPNAYIFNLAQLELEEYIMPVEEKEEFDQYQFHEVFNLNAVNINSWLEISSLNEDENNILFFSSLFTTDELEGNFKYNYYTGDVKYYYNIDSLNLEKVYYLAPLAGYLYAGYTFDYFMNEYVVRRMEEEDKRRSTFYYHYERETNILSVAKDDQKFIPMD